MKKYFFMCLLLSLLTTTLYSQEPPKNLSVEQVADSSYITIKKKRKKTRNTLGGGAAIKMNGSQNFDNGFAVEVNLQNYNKNNWGWGLVLNYSQITYNGSYDSLYKSYEETHNIFYVGPALLKGFEGKSAACYLEAGIGVIPYKGSEMDFLFGQYVGVAGEVRTSKKFGLGLKTSMMFSAQKIDSGLFDDNKKRLANFLLTFFVSIRSL